VAQFALELVASAFATSQSGGEDHAVVGQGGGRNALGLMGFAERIQDDGSGDAAVRGDRACVAGVVVEPAEDFGVGLVGEAPVGEVGLPAFVGLFGGEPDVGRLGTLRRCRCHQPGRGEVAADRGDRYLQLMVVLQMPGDGVGSGVQARGAQLGAEFDDQIDGGLRQCAADVTVARMQPRPPADSGLPGG
jgi:hypothetical protein